MAKRKAIPKDVRNQVLVDAMHRCCLCPEHREVVDLHHVVPISEGGPNTEDNLMAVCPTCHATIHRIRNRYTSEQLRMYKERWVRLCTLGLPLDVRMMWAFNYTRPPVPSQMPPSIPASHLPDIAHPQPVQVPPDGSTPITPEIEHWLQDAGYEYHCFISWAHAPNRDLIECARKVREAIEQDLALSIPNPRVFFTETDVGGGAKRRETLARALCRSIAMVAICAPIYYHPAYEQCGLEWAAMDMLSGSRLPGEDFKAIIPVILRHRGSLPNPVAEIRCIDFSRVTARGRRYYNSTDFRQKIMEVCEQIERIAFVMACNGVLASCEQFQLPTESAFSNYEAGRQPFPFRSLPT